VSDEEQQGSGSSGSGQDRDRFVECAKALRAALDKAIAAKLGGALWRVLAAVIELTVTWSKLEDEVYLAQIARIAGMHDGEGNARPGDVKRVAHSLKQLRDAGIITYVPSRRHGQKSRIGLVPADGSVGSAPEMGSEIDPPSLEASTSPSTNEERDTPPGGIPLLRKAGLEEEVEEASSEGESDRVLDGGAVPPPRLLTTPTSPSKTGDVDNEEVSVPPVTDPALVDAEPDVGTDGLWDVGVMVRDPDGSEEFDLFQAGLRHEAAIALQDNLGAPYIVRPAEPVLAREPKPPMDREPDPDLETEPEPDLDPDPEPDYGDDEDGWDDDDDA
jgi:hypothetical protein